MASLSIIFLLHDQADELYKHCEREFARALRVGNVIERLEQAHDTALLGLQQTALHFLQEKAYIFHVRFCISPQYPFSLLHSDFALSWPSSLSPFLNCFKTLK